VTPEASIGARIERRTDTIPKAALRSVSQPRKTSVFIPILSCFIQFLSHFYPGFIYSYPHLIAFLSARIVTWFFYERRHASGVGLGFRTVMAQSKKR
jgi:hypothetical protein